MRSKLLLLSFIIIGLAACVGSNRKFTVVGDITGMPEQSVVLEQVDINMISIIDSVRSGADGHFEISGNNAEAGIYRLRFKDNKYILLSLDKGNVKINSTWANIDNDKVTGSDATNNLRILLNVYRQTVSDMNTLKIVIDTLHARGSDSMLALAKQNYEDLNSHFTLQVENYADTNSYEANAIFAARLLNEGSQGPFLETFTASLSRKFPNTKMTKDFIQYFDKVSAKHKEPVQVGATIDVGAMAPEISMPDADSKTIALSSLKGHYVLLDFWASWCGPCRGENPNVVSAYEKYKSKNFTIYSVSLDNQKDKWLNAIKDDHLTWTQVSDLKGWSSAAAAVYGVQSIPTNFLIDPKGKIIARNLRGSELEDMLQTVLVTHAVK